ncbi:MAG: hypothetical protein ABGZ17_20725 [Planctomycetaceae bacterium]
MHAFQSADGIHWSPLSDDPVITEGAFDSQNVAFWDAARQRYVDFHRDFRNGVRDIKTCTSKNFLEWTDPDWIEYPGVPPEHLYTNAITAHPQAPHIFIGFPKRFVPSRNPTGHPYAGVSDGVFMSSRDGETFVGHGGSCPGFRSQFSMQNDDEIAVVVMVNATVSPSHLRL